MIPPKKKNTLGKFLRGFWSGENNRTWFRKSRFIIGLTQTDSEPGRNGADWILKEVRLDFWGGVDNRFKRV